jgi:hypothetical protein
VVVGAFEIKADGQPIAVGYQHQLGALFTLGLADRSSPFLAGTKLPSRNALSHASFSCSSKRASKVRQMLFQYRLAPMP